MITLDKHSIQSGCAPLVRDEDVTTDSIAEIAGERSLRFWRRPNGQIIIFTYGMEDIIVVDGVMVHVTRAVVCDNCGDEDGTMSRNPDGEVWCSYCLGGDDFLDHAEIDDFTDIPMFDGL
jgi:hypothetical protein